MNLATVILILGLIYFCWVWPAFRYLCLACLLVVLLGGGWWLYSEIQKQRRYEAIAKAAREGAELDAALKEVQARIEANKAQELAEAQEVEAKEAEEAEARKRKAAELDKTIKALEAAMAQREAQAQREAMAKLKPECRDLWRSPSIDCVAWMGLRP